MPQLRPLTTVSTHVNLVPDMTGLSARQTQILKALIDEYIETAEPAGSLALEKKYSLGISPATIRNEMANLTRMGYLRQPHTSAGRVPSPAAMKFYISQLMEEKEVGIVDEVKVKEDLKEQKNNFADVMEEATEALADQTHSLAIITTSDGEIWKAGFSNMYESPEFFAAPLVCKSVFSLLEEPKTLHQLFFERLTGLSPIEVLFGEEFDWPYFAPVGVVASRFSASGKSGAIGVFGPFGLNYSSVIPVVRGVKEAIEEVLSK